MSEIDHAHFLAHALELERDALERYREFVDVLAAHHNPPVQACFADMVEECTAHVAEVEERAGSTRLPDLEPWRFDWPGAEAPESPSHEALHYRMTPRRALELALAGELAAQAWYEAASRSAKAPATRDLALHFAAEEAEHAQRLRRLLDAEPPDAAHHREDDDPPVDAG